MSAQGNRLRIELYWSGDIAQTPSVDALAFCLADSGKVRKESDMIFYNNRQSAGGAVVMADPEGEARGLRCQPFLVALDQLPPDISRIVFAINVDSGGGGVLCVGQLKQLSLCACGGRDSALLARCDFALGDAQETALIMGELYRRNGEWKLKSVGQGFGAGLSALAQSYGVTVADGAQATGPMARSHVPVPQGSAAPAAGKTVVPSIKIDPPATGFGEFTITLAWGAPPPMPGAAPPPPVAKPGLIGSLLGAKPAGPRTVDLDLCCLYELVDGYRGVVQALGNNFGSFNSAPFVELMGDERKGTGQQNEVLRINGKFWKEVKRLLPFAMIFDGLPNWSQAMGRATIRVPDQVPVSARLDQNTQSDRACSIALIENEGGKIVIHKRVETFRNPRELDQFYAWGLRWTAGMKD